MAYLKTKPYALHCGEGQSLQSAEARIAIKATAEQTNGAFNLFEVMCPQGYATSLDIHYTEDVAVYVLEGALAFFWGSEKKAAVPGSYFYKMDSAWRAIRPRGFYI